MGRTFWRIRIGIAANSIVALVICQSAVKILLLTDERKRVFGKAGLPLPAFCFGILDLILLALFLLPPVRKIGFLLNICYYSAAVATRLVIKENPTEPALILVLLSASMLITDRDMFFNTKAKETAG